MRSTLGQLDLKSNGIGFLRILFASIVIWSHGWHIGNFGTDPIFAYSHEKFLTGYLAVGGFFALSGFLITRSGETTPSPTRFLWHRILRIYPGFWTCLIVTAFVIAPIMYSIEFGSLHGFLAVGDGPFAYIYRNASLIISQQNIGRLMAAYPSPETINGSIWTLAWEFNCYICVGVLGAFTIYRCRKAAPIAIAILLAANLYFEKGTHNALLIGLVPSLGLFFLFWLGSAAYLYRNRIPMHWSLAAVAVLVAAVALPTALCREIVPISIAYLTLFAAMCCPVRGFDRRVDLSYGVYLYGTPILKLGVLLGLSSLGFPAYYVAVMVIALAIAGASWYVIERPSLTLRSLRLPDVFTRFGISDRRYGDAGS